jgi:signal peptidase I
MYPLIRREGDLIVIKKCEGDLKKYDVPLFKRSTGEYVLHRIVKVKDGKYDIRGDNCINGEKGIERSAIIGVLDAVIRGGKEIKMNSFLQKMYARFWCAVYLPRAFFLRVKLKLKRIFK